MTTWFPPPRVTSPRGGRVLRWGIAGPGGIAEDFAAALLAHTDQRITAVASRSADRADAFARRFGIPAAHGAYERLVADPDVDIVYVATPHAQHRPMALQALAGGKHVLVEKPLALTAREGEEIATAARSTGLLAAEAMWTRYLPQFDVLAQVLARGDLGTVRLVTADVGWQVDPEHAPRFLDPEQGGSALDMGVYGYWFAHFALGRPDVVAVAGSNTGTATGAGVDEQSVVVLRAAEALASVTTSMAVTTTGLASIQGTGGSARFLEPFVFPARFVVTHDAATHEWHDRSGLRGRAGLAWQAAALADAVAEGRTDSPVHGLDDAVAVLRTIDRVRAELTGPQAQPDLRPVVGRQ